MMEIKLDNTPRIGLGATVHLWGSQLSCTITSVSKNKFRVVMKKDKVEYVAPQGTPYVLKFKQDDNGETFVATRRQDGTYRLANSSTVLVEIGVRKEEQYMEDNANE